MAGVVAEQPQTSVKLATTSPKKVQFISVYVGAGEEERLYLVRRKVLESTSPFFAKALSNAFFVEARSKELRFPEDDPAAWELLIHWLNKRVLTYRTHNKPVLCIRSWVLGDKYEIPGFQDVVMLELLLMSEGPRTETKVALIVEAVEHTSPFSKLRMWAAEEAVFSLTNGNAVYHAFNELDGYEFWGDFAEATRRSLTNQGRMHNSLKAWRFVNRGWMRYMVGQDDEELSQHAHSRLKHFMADLNKGGHDFRDLASLNKDGRVHTGPRMGITFPRFPPGAAIEGTLW